MRSSSAARVLLVVFAAALALGCNSRKKECTDLVMKTNSPDGLEGCRLNANSASAADIDAKIKQLNASAVGYEAYAKDVAALPLTDEKLLKLRKAYADTLIETAGSCRAMAKVFEAKRAILPMSDFAPVEPPRAHHDAVQNDIMVECDWPGAKK